MIMEDNFTSEESGLCVTFLSKFFDGEKLVKSLNKENLELHRHTLLYDVMRLKDNISLVPSDVLEFIKTSFHVL